MKADTGTSHLSKETFPAPSGNQQPFPQKGHELLLGEFPALQLVGALAVHPTEQVRLPGFCKQQMRMVSYGLTWIGTTLLFPLISSAVVLEAGVGSLQYLTEGNGFLEKATFKKRL